MIYYGRLKILTPPTAESLPNFMVTSICLSGAPFKRVLGVKPAVGDERASVFPKPLTLNPKPLFFQEEEMWHGGFA